MLISVEGCIAAGKTTVATGLAKFRTGRLLLENFDLNPFLREFYLDPEGNAFETEFAFLLVHYHQLRTSPAQSRDEEVVADFHLGKDLLFAEMNMKNPEELQAFRRLSDLCTTKVASPDVLIFLSAPLPLIVDRVRSRGRDFEQDIAISYYSTLIAQYEEFYEDFVGAKLRVAMDQWDFVQQPILFSRLSDLIDISLVGIRELNG